MSAKTNTFLPNEPFLQLCNFQGNLLFSRLILDSVFIDYIFVRVLRTSV